MTKKEISMGAGLIGIASLVMLLVGVYVGTYKSSNVSQKRAKAQTPSGTTLQLSLKGNNTIFGKVTAIKEATIEITQNYLIQPLYTFSINDMKKDDVSSNSTVNQTAIIHITSATTFTRQQNTIPYHFRPTPTPQPNPSFADIKTGDIVNVTINPTPTTTLSDNEFEASAVTIETPANTITGTIASINMTNRTITIEPTAQLDTTNAREVTTFPRVSTSPMPSTPVEPFSTTVEAIHTVHITSDTEIVKLPTSGVMQKIANSTGTADTARQIAFFNLGLGMNVTVYTFADTLVQTPIDVLLIEASASQQMPLPGGSDKFTPPQTQPLGMPRPLLK